MRLVDLQNLYVSKRFRIETGDDRRYNCLIENCKYPNRDTTKNGSMSISVAKCTDEGNLLNTPIWVFEVNRKDYPWDLENVLLSLEVEVKNIFEKGEPKMEDLGENME